ncbi:MAG TPA: hypothetical protein VM029_01740 [Opitutaceae bacterium]|nr:hypothetical protein [Opitutaceae bacterium]
MNPTRIFSWALLLAGVSCAVAWAQGDIDYNRARELLQKMKAGQALSSEERDYVMRAREARQGRGGRAGSVPAAADAAAPVDAVKVEDLVPLSEMTILHMYKGEEGGLYGGGRNEPSPEHLAAAMKESAKIVPLDGEGLPSPDGKIVLLGVGMSNTTQEFRRFKEIADADPAKSPRVVIVDGAQGGQDARLTSDPTAAFWPRIDERLRQAGVTAKQVQVIWLKQAIARPDGEFPASAKRLQNYLTTIVGTMKARYPNARISYHSSRTFAGYAVTPLNPEPYAYEGAFAVRWLINDQIGGNPQLNFDPARGEVKAPLLLWGPYLWAQGENPRQGDGLSYTREDFTAKDGTHPTASGQQKVAKLLLTFFKTEPTTRGWFVAQEARR